MTTRAGLSGGRATSPGTPRQIASFKKRSSANVKASTALVGTAILNLAKFASLKICFQQFSFQKTIELLGSKPRH